MTARFVRKLGALCLAAVAFGITQIASPAQAAVTDTRPATMSGSVAAVADPQVVAASPSVCHDPLFDGSYYCGYGAHLFTLSNGTEQIFVIGTDYSVYTRWATTSGVFSAWVNMSGQIRRSYSTSDFKVGSCGSQPVVYVVGTDNRWYNDARRTNGTWTGWRLGNVVACPA